MVVRGPVVREALDQLVGGELNAKSVHDNVVLEVAAVQLVRGALEAESVHEQGVGVVGLYVVLLVGLVSPWTVAHVRDYRH